MDRYITSFVINKKNYYCIWYTDDTDGFETKDNKLIYFLTLESLKNYCVLKNIILKDDEITCYKIDYFVYWLKDTTIEIDCTIFLNFWNIIADVAFSIKKHFYGEEDGEQNEIVDVYSRLFYGTNPKVLRGEDGKMYYPKWEEKDIQIIKSVVKDGLYILSKALDIDLNKEFSSNEV